MASARNILLKEMDHHVECCDCEYSGPAHKTVGEAVEAHNRIARAGDLPNAEELRLREPRYNFSDAAGVAVLDFINRWRREREEGGE